MQARQSVSACVHASEDLTKNARNHSFTVSNIKPRYKYKRQCQTEAVPRRWRDYPSAPGPDTGGACAASLPLHSGASLLLLVFCHLSQHPRWGEKEKFHPGAQRVHARTLAKARRGESGVNTIVRVEPVCALRRTFEAHCTMQRPSHATRPPERAPPAGSAWSPHCCSRARMACSVSAGLCPWRKPMTSRKEAARSRASAGSRSSAFSTGSASSHSSASGAATAASSSK